MSTNSLISDDTELFSSSQSFVDKDKYWEDLAPESMLHYNLRTLSYSSLLLLHGCARKFELSRLTQRALNPDNDEDAHGHLDFGTIVGNGIQELLVSKNLDKAIFAAFISWKDNLDSERGFKSKKTFWHAIAAIQKFQELANGYLSQYELAWFNGKPAIELGFTIDMGAGFTYRGKLDALLVHKVTKSFLPLECKTTGNFTAEEAMYGNSAQGVGYGIVIDRVAHEMGIHYTDYNIFYPVYLTRKAEWIPFRFNKRNTSRALWLQSLLLDINHIQQYAELEYFPCRGESCFAYGRPCKFYESCQFSNKILIGDIKNIDIRLDKKTDYPLRFSIAELVEAQVANNGDE